VISVFFNLLWRYPASGGRLLARNYDPVAVAAITRQYRFGPLLYVAAFGLAFVNVAVSVGLCFALAVFFAVPERQARR
jgi:TMEM175 potassium channel family protein